MAAFSPDQIARLTEVIAQLSKELEAKSRIDDQLRRLCMIPGIGLVTSGPVAAFAPDPDPFDSRRNFAARLVLCPGKGPLAASPSWARSAKWIRPTCAAC